MLELEYVASAPGRLGFTNQEIMASDEFRELLKMYFGIIHRDRPKEEYDYAMLYNAYTEQEIPEKLETFGWFDAKTRYADSGGLQAITLGADITDEFKKSIYKNQCLNADIGMCFDEIPLHIASDGGSKIGSQNDRYLFENMIVPKGIETGQHINNHILEFRKYTESNAKVMAIGQGQDYDSYAKYIGAVVDNIDVENYEYIQGVSLSGACRGNNLFTNIDIFNTVRHLDVPNQFKNHIHFLGAGTFSKIIPAIIMHQSGFLKDFKLSFDSTSHMSSYDFGFYQFYDPDTLKTNMISLSGKKRSAEVDNVYRTKIYEPYKELWDHIGVTDLEDLFRYTIYTDLDELKGVKPKEFRRHSPKSMYVYHLVKIIYIHSQILDFNKVLNDYRLGRIGLDNMFSDKKFKKALTLLKNVRDDQDYMEWAKITKRYYLNPTNGIIQKFDDFDQFYSSTQVMSDLF